MCVYIAAEVAKGLDHAHRRRDEQMRPLGIVHRDVSPQNVLLSREGEVKVTDFGIAKARDCSSQRRRARPRRLDEASGAQLQGKYSYMSPEQARGEAVDARSDLFSLGTVLYEMLAGVNPFRAPTTFETLRRVKAGEYPPVELVRQDLPSGLGALFERALSPTPEKRFADAGRMYESLLAYLYASGDRFGADDLSTFVSRFRDRVSARPPELSQVVVAEDTSEPIEITPVEIPSQPQASPIAFRAPQLLGRHFARSRARRAARGHRARLAARRLGGRHPGGATPARARHRGSLRGLHARRRIAPRRRALRSRRGRRPRHRDRGALRPGRPATHGRSGREQARSARNARSSPLRGRPRRTRSPLATRRAQARRTVERAARRSAGDGAAARAELRRFGLRGAQHPRSLPLRSLGRRPQEIGKSRPASW